MKVTLEVCNLDALVDAIAERVAEKLLDSMSRAGTNGNDDLRLYTEPEAAARLGMAQHQLRDHRFCGRIEAIKKGRRLYYTHKELRRFATCSGN